MSSTREECTCPPGSCWGEEGLSAHRFCRGAGPESNAAGAAIMAAVDQFLARKGDAAGAEVEPQPAEAVRLVSIYVRDGEVMAHLVIGRKHVDAHVPRKILGSLISGLGMAASTLLVADRRA